ncbi:MAG: thioredoxin family protein [Akkermansia sp.]|nr:thioredoxin family protein [Akkermansia sp.]
MFKQLFFALATTAIVAPAQAATEWMTDFEAAQAKATAEGKALLVNFTGSDWCGWCVQLKKELLNTPQFSDYIATRFIAVEVDVPNNASRVGGEEKLMKNRELCRRFSITVFPSVVAMTPSGIVTGGFTGSTGLTAAKASLNAALKNAQELEAAQSLQGAQKAQALLKIYRRLPEDLRDAGATLRDEIIALDTENTTGLRDSMRAEAELMRIEQQLQPLVTTDLNAAIRFIDEALKTAMPVNREVLEQAKINFLQQKIYTKLGAAKNVQDIEEVKLMLLNEFVPAIPEDDREEVRLQIEKEFADPAKVLKEQTGY